MEGQAKSSWFGTATETGFRRAILQSVLITLITWFGGPTPSAAQEPDDGKDQQVSTADDFLRLTLGDRKSTRLNSSHVASSYAVFCLKKKNFLGRGCPDECGAAVTRISRPRSAPAEHPPPPDRPHAAQQLQLRLRL